VRTTRASSIEDYVRKHPQLGTFGDETALFEVAIRLAAGKPGLIVDVGCGEGRTLASVARRRMPNRVGIDLSLHRCKLARGRGISAIVADSNALPLESCSSALVFCRHVIEHVVDDAMTLKDIRRILRPDGFLYLETPQRLPGAWYFYRNPQGRRVLDPTHVREYRSPEELINVLTASGLFPIQVQTRPVTFPFSHVLYRLLSGNKSPGESTVGLLERNTFNLRVPRYREIQVLARPLRDGDRELMNSERTRR
jgi:SAM-dependent methyltransferase